jgi:hypothetical protein
MARNLLSNRITQARQTIHILETSKILVNWFSVTKREILVVKLLLDLVALLLSEYNLY